MLYEGVHWIQNLWTRRERWKIRRRVSWTQSEEWIQSCKWNLRTFSGLSLVNDPKKNTWLFPSPIDHTQRLNGLKPYSSMKKTTNSSEKPSSNLRENTSSNMSTITLSERLLWLEASILLKVNLNKLQFIILITKTSALQQDKPGNVHTRTNILFPGLIKTW